MNAGDVSDTWERGNPYEQYIGRWSREIAPLFLSWLNQPEAKRWLDVGCGTGALSAAILDRCAPSTLVGIEPSEGFLRRAAQSLGSRARFLAGHAASIPLDDGAADVVVSALVLNFVPELPAALAEMKRVTVPGGTIAAYVWDYADRMEIIKAFWDAAAALDPTALQLHESARFADCNPTSLRNAFEQAGLGEVETLPLDLTAEFNDFDDYWQPFLGGQGPAPSYAMSLTADQRAALRTRLASTISARKDGTLSLQARAWAVRAVRH